MAVEREEHRSEGVDEQGADHGDVVLAGRINQLRQALREYYPSALEAFAEWTTAASWAFIERFGNRVISQV